MNTVLNIHCAFVVFPNVKSNVRKCVSVYVWDEIYDRFIYSDMNRWIAKLHQWTIKRTYFSHIWFRAYMFTCLFWISVTLWRYSICPKTVTVVHWNVVTEMYCALFVLIMCRYMQLITYKCIMLINKFYIWMRSIPVRYQNIQGPLLSG